MIKVVKEDSPALSVSQYMRVCNIIFCNCVFSLLFLTFSRSVTSQLFVTPWTVSHQASLSMEFSRQEYWSGLPFPSAGDLPDPGIESASPALQVDSLQLSHLGRPSIGMATVKTTTTKQKIPTVSEIVEKMKPL